MSTHEDQPSYIGSRYQHKKTGFAGEVVREVVPNPWTPDRVILTLECSGDQKEFQLAELEEIDEP
jgi:hypothetical protein